MDYSRIAPLTPVETAGIKYDSNPSLRSMVLSALKGCWSLNESGYLKPGYQARHPITKNGQGASFSKEVNLEEQHADTQDWLSESQAHALARRVASTPGYRVLEVRHAWSAATAWQVEIEDRRTGERLLLLNDDQFDARPTAGEPTTGTTATGPSHEPAAAPASWRTSPPQPNRSQPTRWSARPPLARAGRARVTSDPIHGSGQEVHHTHAY